MTLAGIYLEPSSQRSENRFLCALFVHEKLSLRRDTWSLGCHSAMLVLREEECRGPYIDVAPR